MCRPMNDITIFLHCHYSCIAQAIRLKTIYIEFSYILILDGKSLLKVDMNAFDAVFSTVA